MITNKSSLFGFADNYAKNPLPEPFEAIHSKRPTGFTYTCIKSLLKAALLIARENLVAAGKTPAVDTMRNISYAAGTASAEGGTEKVFIEMVDAKYPDEIQLMSYAPFDGKIQGAVYKRSTQRCTSYKIGGGHLDGTALWLAYLYCNINDGGVSAVLKSLQDLLESSKGTPVDRIYMDHVLPFCGQVYNDLMDGKKEFDLPTDTVSLLKKRDIQKGKEVPSYGKTITGTFEILISTTAAEAVCTFDISEFEGLNFVKEKLSDEEKLLIPSIPESNVTPQVVADLLTEMKETWDEPDAIKVTQALFEGGAGSGKSYAARLIAAVLKRPFVSFTCSPNTDEVDIKGCLLPVVEEDRIEGTAEDKELLQVIYNSTEEEVYDNMAEAMGLPTSTDIMYMPDWAYEQLMGCDHPGETPDAREIYALLSAKVSAKIKQLMDLATKGASDGNVKYKYFPSPIIRAIQNGWVLELQEPTCMLQQSMLSCLFDVLDKESIGVVNTQNGDIYKHPDFICIATMNRKYRGTKPLNQAARSRFQFFQKLETPTLQEAMARVIKKVGIDESLARPITEIFKTLEARAKDINVDEPTMRSLISFANAIKRGKDMMFALEHYVLWAVTTDEEELEDLKVAIEDQIAASNVQE